MPKSLGQIHTVDFNYECLPTLTGTSNAFLCDGSGALSKQFNRNIRMMQIYKLVGADLVVQVPDSAGFSDTDRVIVKGRMRYFQPTKGRCAALRDAYQQFRSMAKAQGVSPQKNKLFDFRVLPRPFDQYPHNANWGPIYNLATLDGTDSLCMTGGSTGISVFDSYNAGVAPKDATVTDADFASGLNTWQAGIQTDFVLNEGTIQSGNSDIADLELEEIPFELAFDLSARRVATLQWRPDPALYIGVLGGWVEIVLDEIKASVESGGSGAAAVEMDVSLHFAGWKSIVNPLKKDWSKGRSTKKNVARDVKKLARRMDSLLKRMGK